LGWLAAINLLAGTVNALRPHQSQDLKTVREWSTLWLWEAANPYAVARADYPPNALIFLSPLALVPEQLVALIWVGLSLGLAAISVWLTFRMLFPQASLRAVVLPALLFLSWGGLRIGLGVGQFHLLALTLGLAAVATADKRPHVSGVLLGLALIKPHLAGAFFLWAVLTRRWRVAVIALLIVLLGVLAFAARLGRSPIELALSYLSVLESELAGSTPATGVDLRPLLHLMMGPTQEASVVHVGLVAVLLAAVVGLAMRLGRAQHPGPILLSLCCVFALLALPHSVYDIVLLLPVALWLHGASRPSATVAWSKHATSKWIVFWLLQAALVLEVPGIAYKLTGHSRAALPLLTGVDTAIVAVVFAYLLWTARVRTARLREQRDPGAGGWVGTGAA
jgi:hypothetical protein